MHLNFDILVVNAGNEAGAREVYQDLVVDLVKLTHRAATAVRPAPGDWGIDVFLGDLEGATSVWQCKFFRDGVGASQKKQIRESFAQLMTQSEVQGFEVRAWTLCVPCELSAEEHRWWSGWKRGKELAHGVVIEMWDGPELRRILLSPDADGIREHYFRLSGSGPDSAIEMRIEELPRGTDYEDALFVAQLKAAGLQRLDTAKRAFFNAEILARDVTDKGIAAELDALFNLRAKLHALWELRFNDSCAQHDDLKLPGLVRGVMSAIEEQHRGTLLSLLRATVVHKSGVMHQLVDEGKAGWTADFEDLVALYGL